MFSFNAKIQKSKLVEIMVNTNSVSVFAAVTAGQQLDLDKS